MKKKAGPYVVKVKTLENSWHDRDEVLLHVSMQVLVDFIDEECGPDSPVDWNADPEHRRIRKELQRIYDWWTKKRPARPGILDFTKGTKEPNEICLTSESQKQYPAYFRALDRYNKAEDKWNAEDQAMLHSLINLRHYLWT